MRVFVVAMLAMVVYAAADTSFAWLMKPMLDGSFVAQDPAMIKLIPLAIISIFLLRGIAAFVSGYGMSWVGWRIVQQLRGEMFDKLLHMPAAVYDQASSGELLSKLTFNTERVAGSATKAITVLVRDSLTVFGLLALLLYHSVFLTITILLAAPLCALILFLITKQFRSISKKIQESMGRVSHIAEEIIEGQRVVKIFGGQAYEANKFSTANIRNRKLQMRMVSTKTIATSLVELIVAVALASIVYLATMDNILQTISVGTFVSFMLAMLMLFGPLKRLTEVNEVLQTGIAAGESVFELLDAYSEPNIGTYRSNRVRGDLSFDNVSFRYAKDASLVLDAVNFTATAGQTIALVGRSGSGKTTIANLLARFYGDLQGTITIDGQAIDAYELDNLRSQIAYVGQEVILFNDTVASNIAYGKLATASSDSIRQAAEAAHAAEFVENLAQGYDTIVGENGVLLSGGQRQRLAIARALLKDAPILILDEATSALDSESELAVQAGLAALLKNRTTLVIAHRLSTIENADTILVLDNGKIIERGNHRQLIQARGHYARLHRLQFKEPVEQQ